MIKRKIPGCTGPLGEEDNDFCPFLPPPTADRVIGMTWAHSILESLRMERQAPIGITDNKQTEF
jgi:hypothetical protein